VQELLLPIPQPFIFGFSTCLPVGWFGNTTTATIYFKLLFNFKNNRLQKQNLQQNYD
jgi:hypothetical protein